MIAPTMDDLLTPGEVSRILGVTVWTLQAWRAQGKGPAWTKLGTSRTSPIRYSRKAVQEFVSEGAGL